MTTSDPERPSQPFGDNEYPSLEDSQMRPGQGPPVDYPIDAGLPPPVYPMPYPGYPDYPGALVYYPGAYDPYRPMKPPGTNGMAIAALAVSLGSLALFCAIPPIVAVILGVIADESDQAHRPGGLRAGIGGHHYRCRPHRVLAALPAAVHRRRMAVGAVAGHGREEHKGV
jgi:hypothetical protein